MKYIVFIGVFFVLQTGTYGQDTTKKKHPRFIAPLFIDARVYTQGSNNRFDMTYRFSAGTHAVLTLGRRTSVMFGGTFANNFALGKYALTSRSFAQGFFHGAAGVTYAITRTSSDRLVGGLVWARVSYFPGEYSPAPRGVTNPFTLFSKEVRDSLPGVRGIYYNGIYLYSEWRKRFSDKKSISVESNILLPVQLKEPLHSWQPRSALVHVVRLKSSYVLHKETLMIDIGVPSITKGRVAYATVSPVHTTGRVEYNHSIRLSNGALKVALGYERDWHALNFPNLLKHDRFRGTWEAWYVGIRFESTVISKK